MVGFEKMMERINNLSEEEILDALEKVRKDMENINDSPFSANSLGMLYGGIQHLGLEKFLKGVEDDGSEEE